MKIKSAFYLKALPHHIMIVAMDGKHYVAPSAPFRTLQQSDFSPMPGYDVQKPERFCGHFDAVPGYALRFYGLEVAQDDN